MTIKTPTLYDLIDVPPTATHAEVKKACRKALRETHPDMNGGRASNRYLAVQEASEVLLDADRRAEYDNSIGIDTNESGQATTPPRDQATTSNTRKAKPRTNRARARSFPTIPVTPHFTTPTDTPPMYPHPDYGKLHKYHWVSVILFAGSFLAELYFLFFHGLNFVNNPTALMTLLLIVLWVLRIAIALIGLFGLMFRTISMAGIVFPPILGLLTLNSHTAPGEAWFLWGIAIAWVCYIITLAAPDRTRGGTYIMPVENISHGNTFGTPGAGLENSGFSEHNVQAGIAGEQATAEALNCLLKTPGMYVYHGLKFALDSDADIDHAVVYGDRVALIDSKLWPTDLYEWVNPSMIRQGDGRQRSVHMDKALANYKTYTGDTKATLKAWVCIHPAKGGDGFAFDNMLAPTDIRMGDINSTVNEIAEFLFDQENVRINRHLINVLAALKKKEN